MQRFTGDPLGSIHIDILYKYLRGAGVPLTGAAPSPDMLDLGCLGSAIDDVLQDYTLKKALRADPRSAAVLSRAAMFIRNRGKKGDAFEKRELDAYMNLVKEFEAWNDGLPPINPGDEDLRRLMAYHSVDCVDVVRKELGRIREEERGEDERRNYGDKDRGKGKRRRDGCVVM